MNDEHVKEAINKLVKNLRITMDSSGTIVEWRDDLLLELFVAIDDLVAYGAACGGEKWTPCSEKMPAPGTVCLVTRTDGCVSKYTFTHGGKWINLTGDVSPREVTAWRTFPAAYQTDKQEKP